MLALADPEEGGGGPLNISLIFTPSLIVFGSFMLCLTYFVSSCDTSFRFVSFRFVSSFFVSFRCISFRGSRGGGWGESRGWNLLF
jgi:hypothetical protein